MFNGPITFDKTVRIVGGLLIITAIILIVARLSGVLLPFFAAWLIAYMLNPFVDFLQYKCKLKNRALCVIITIVLLVGIVVGGMTIFASSITKEAAIVERMVDNYVNNDYQYNVSPQTQDWMESVLNTLKSNRDEILKKALPSAYNFLESSFEYIAGLVVMFIVVLYIFFILMDFDSMSVSWQNMVPEKYRGITHQIFHDLASGMNIYFRKQALISLIVGCLFAIGFKILGLPMGITMGLFVGVLNMVPYLHTLGLIPPIVVALVQSAQYEDIHFWPLLLGIIGVFCIVQLIIDFVLTPKIMGHATGLKPAVILLALSIWGSLLGVLGMIIALPVTTIMISYYTHFIIEGKSGAELVGKGAFPKKPIKSEDERKQ
ncbi:MAG: AI-2E family transporter [Paludibacteraceae bacterium]|nr:AI-2E family transporter [Paludibacteraceae bacterium]